MWLLGRVKLRTIRGALVILRYPNLAVAYQKQKTINVYHLVQTDLYSILHRSSPKFVYEGPGSGSTHVPFGHNVAAFVKSLVLLGEIY